MFHHLGIKKMNVQMRRLNFTTRPAVKYRKSQSIFRSTDEDFFFKRNR